MAASAASVESPPPVDPGPGSGAPPSPRERRVAKTRRAIIDAARDLIDRQGYVETTIDQIADRADIASRTFFRYFPSKEALIFADFEETREQLWALLEARPADEHPLRSLLLALSAFAEIVEAHSERLSWGFRIAHDHPSVAGYELTAIKAETAGRIGHFMADRLGVDPDDDPRPEAWTMIAMSLFGSAVRLTMAPKSGHRRHPSARATFLDLLEDTAAALRTASRDL